jgi:hypothetical protein
MPETVLRGDNAPAVQPILERAGGPRDQPSSVARGGILEYLITNVKVVD